MIRRMKQDTPQIENTIAKAVDFEIQMTDITKRNVNRSLGVALGAVMLCVTMVCSYFLILPLNKLETYVLIADPYTGVTRPARMDDDETFSRLVANEPILRASITDYINARESFDFPRTAYRDFKLVRWMSTPAVFRQYDAIYQADNPDEPLKTFGKEKAVWVVFVSTQLRRIEDEKDMKYEATVRFQRHTYEKKGGKARLHDSKIATMEFTFDRRLHSDRNQRANNPLGFLVTAYRVDNDSSAPPPPPEGATPAAQPTAAPAAAPVAPQPNAAQNMQVPQFGAPAGAAPSNAQPQPQYPAQPVVQPQPAATAGQVPNQVNGVRN